MRHLAPGHHARTRRCGGGRAVRAASARRCPRASPPPDRRRGGRRSGPTWRSASRRRSSPGGRRRSRTRSSAATRSRPVHRHRRGRSRRRRHAGAAVESAWLGGHAVPTPPPHTSRPPDARAGSRRSQPPSRRPLRTGLARRDPWPHDATPACDGACAFRVGAHLSGQVPASVCTLPAGRRDETGHTVGATTPSPLPEPTTDRARKPTTVVVTSPAGCAAPRLPRAIVALVPSGRNENSHPRTPRGTRAHGRRFDSVTASRIDDRALPRTDNRGCHFSHRCGGLPRAIVPLVRSGWARWRPGSFRDDVNWSGRAPTPDSAPPDAGRAASRQPPAARRQ